MQGEVVRSGGLTGYRRLLRSIGHEPDVLLTDAGLRPADLDDPDRYIAYHGVIAAIEAPAERLGIADFGLRLADYQDISIIGPLAFAMQNAASAYEAMRLTAENISFQSPAIRIALQNDPEPEFERVSFDIILAQPRPMAQAVEHAVGVMKNALTMISANTLRVQAIHFRHDAVGRPQDYHRHLGVSPVFGSEWNGLLIERRAFRSRLPQSSRLMGEYARKFAALRAPGEHLPIEQRVREVLRAMMRIRHATLPETSRILALHPRTLQQRLTARGTSFDQLRDETRREMADIYLGQPNLPLAHVAHLLGYAEQAVLTRSCKRWFGCPPSQRRRALIAV